MITMGFELTRLATATDERPATVGAGRTVSRSGLPIGSLTLKRQIAEHTGAPIAIALGGAGCLIAVGLAAWQVPTLRRTA